MHESLGAGGLLEAAPDAIIGVTADGVIQLVNAQAERLFGYPRAELIGQQVEILVPDAAQVVHPGHRQRYFAAPTHRPMGAGIELAGRRKDGTEFPAEISLSLLQVTHGPLAAAAVRDVTDRKRAEAKFRGLLEAAPDAILGVNVSGRIVLANAQAERLFGYPREELIGEPVEILVPDSAHAVHPGHRMRYFGTPVSRPMGAGQALAGRRRDGTEFPAEISLSGLETEDGLIVSAAVRDVTDRLEEAAERERLKAAAERDRFEARMHQSERLESLGQLAGGVAHDFNNLLGVILNYAGFVAEEVAAAAADGAGGTRWAPVLGDVAQIRRAAERATDLTHQLLAFGRREVVRPRVLDLNKVVTDVELLLRRTLGEHVQLCTVLAPELWRTVADPGQIEQVLVNLAVNARDAMHAGGTLTIETANVDVDPDQAAQQPHLAAGRHVRIRVSDTGAGMTEEVRRHAWEPFYTTKGKGEGTGLGLATVYGIITQAGGDLHLHSVLDVGTTVTALLPATEAPLPPPERPVGMRPQPLSEGTVLLVEDEEALREVACRIMTRHGYNVLPAASGAQALEIAASHRGTIDLLLTDVIMPRMLGKEVSERVTALRPEVRVLYMSGYAQPVLASQGTLEEGVVLVEKPFTEADLLDKVHEVLSG
jgi:PAS domain S-box-containing protein